MLARLILVAVLVTAGAACKHNKKANTTVHHRAMFDFPCPEDEITLRVGDTQGARNQASMIAAYGCGKKAVYVYAPDIDTWVIDGAVAPMPEGFQVSPNVTKGQDKKREDKQAAKAEKKGKMGSANPAPAEPSAATPAAEPPPAATEAPVE